MASGGCPGSVLPKGGLPPVTQCSLVTFYAPVFGVASYAGLSMCVMTPRLLTGIFPKKDITHVCLIGTVIGTGSYIYSREHMKKATTNVKLLYSGTGALLLSFGSVLVWAVLRTILPPNATLSTMAGFLSGFAFIKVGRSYLGFIDEQVATKK